MIKFILRTEAIVTHLASANARYYFGPDTLPFQKR